MLSSLKLLQIIRAKSLVTSDKSFASEWVLTATGLGILFAVIAPVIARGKNDSIPSKAVRFALRRRNKRD